MKSVLDYHQNTKHSFHRFARSLGYLDWAAQPDPFRRYDDAPRIELPRAALRPDVPYSALFSPDAAPAPVDEASVGEFLRCAMGLSAWKQAGSSRWALRVNPSSGNLHPTECYIVWNDRVCHYAPREHALEVRCEAAHGRPDSAGTFVVGLTSILWREAWKYGERAFRYCQHDVGHAIGALRFSAALLGWRLSPLEQVSDDQIETLFGLARDEDYGDAEREEPECLLQVTSTSAASIDVAALIAAVNGGRWHGRANVLSRARTEWPAIDTVAAATRRHSQGGARMPGRADVMAAAVGAAPDLEPPDTGARSILLQRRSALGFDASSSISRRTFLSMLRRLDPVAPPWDAIGWTAQVHLMLFVHRVEGVLPGLYAYLRDRGAFDELRAALRPDFLWERTATPNDSSESNLFLLVPADVRFAASRLSCDQDIAADGFFSLAMLARLEPSLREHGNWFYRRLFWECGVVGQVLYLEAEAAGARSTGIGCFYDDPVHEVLGLSGMTWQSLYHFSMGVPVDDGRLTTEAGYPGGW